MATITTKGRRIYIKTAYGEPVVAALKNLGAKWDAERREWWTGAAKREAVEAIINAPAEEHAETAARKASDDLRRDQNNILGRAVIDGTTYYVVAHGENARGDWVKLMFRDGSKTFFKAAGDVEITKEYQRPQSLARLQEFAENLRLERELERDESAPYVESCMECGASYKTFGNVWDDGMSCRRCG